MRRLRSCRVQAVSVGASVVVALMRANAGRRVANRAQVLLRDAAVNRDPAVVILLRQDFGVRGQERPTIGRCRASVSTSTSRKPRLRASLVRPASCARPSPAAGADGNGVGIALRAGRRVARGPQARRSCSAPAACLSPRCPIPRAPRTRRRSADNTAGLLASATCSSRSACRASSSVALKLAIKW